MERVSLLVENPKLRLEMGIRAAEHAQKYDWGKVIKLLEKFFQEIVFNGS